jgi:glycosyltransferase involved in cell wall biosynthesis
MEERFMSNNSPSRHPSISIIIPLYNEEENLYPLVESVFKVLSADVDFLELLLVDDGSYDRTEKMALDLAAREPRIRLIGHERNRGLGAAIRTGLQAARGDLILYTDADLPFDFKLIPELLAQATENNVVIGYRANRGEGLRRYVLTKGYNLICRLALGLHVRDINFACKLIPRRALRGMRLGSEGSFIDAELLMECRRQGFAITEFPLVYYPRTRGLSTLSRPKVIAGILTEMFRYRLRRHRTGFEPIYEFVEETDNKRG